MKKLYIPFVLTFSLIVFLFIVYSVTATETKTSGKSATKTVQKFNTPQQKASYLQKNFKKQLDDLATWAKENGLEEQAEFTQKWEQELPENRIYLYEITSDCSWDSQFPNQLTENVTSDSSKSQKAENIQSWREKFIKLRVDYSNQLFTLGKMCSQKGYSTYAFELFMLALHENPQHKQIRTMIGYSKYKERWATGFEIKMDQNGKVDHPKFGWIPKTYVSRYEKGERYYLRRWMSVQEEAKLRLQKNDPWIIETPHYKVYSYPSLEQGVELSRKLENLARIWNHLYLRFFASENQLKRMFIGQNPNFNVVQHHVYFYRNQDQYISEVSRIMKSDAAVNTLGVYYAEAFEKGVHGAAFFFAGDGYSERTMYHEATHQLFSESRSNTSVPSAGKNVISPGSQSNFWVIEGVAVFMESLINKSEYHELGNPNDDRFFAARYRLLNSKFYVPLSKFSALGAQQFQNDPRVATFYSQAAGLTWFFLFYEEGKYRECFIDYISAVYSGFDTPDTLSKISGISFGVLDKQYADFIQQSVQPEDKDASMD